MDVSNDDILFELAKLHWKYEVSVAKHYECLDVGFENCRVSADQQIAKLAGILKSWQTGPDT